MADKPLFETYLVFRQTSPVTDTPWTVVKVDFYENGKSFHSVVAQFEDKDTAETFASDMGGQ